MHDVVKLHLHSVASEDYVAIGAANDPLRDTPFNMSTRRRCFSVTILDDEFPENAETFTVTITEALPLLPFIAIEPPVATITILDSDCEWTFLCSNFCAVLNRNCTSL